MLGKMLFMGECTPASDICQNCSNRSEYACGNVYCDEKDLEKTRLNESVKFSASMLDVPDNLMLVCYPCKPGQLFFLLDC